MIICAAIHVRCVHMRDFIICQETFTYMDANVFWPQVYSDFSDSSWTCPAECKTHMKNKLDKGLDEFRVFFASTMCFCTCLCSMPGNLERCQKVNLYPAQLGQVVDVWRCTMTFTSRWSTVQA